MDLDSLTGEVLERCDLLARFTEEPGRLTRRFLTPPMHDVHRTLSAWMLEAGLQPRVDAIGNLIGRRASPSNDSHVFAVGSHVDTVPNAGRYDGILGVVLGIAAMKALAGRSLRHAIDVIAFSEEEGVRYATPFLGSRAVCGTFDPVLLTRHDATGITMGRAIQDFGLDPTAIPDAAYTAGQLRGYFEIHIEQGPVLEALGLPLGIVTAIIGQSRRMLRFTGRAGHAGAQPMELRRDALVAAACFIRRVEQIAQATPDLRATVGNVIVEPGAANVVPGMATLTLDVRHHDDVVRLDVLARLLDEAKGLADDRGLGLDSTAILDQAAVPCDVELTERLAIATGITHRLVSGAGHDAMIMASHCPMAMLFVRSPGGISHHPDESVLHDDVKAALHSTIQFLGERGA